MVNDQGEPWDFALAQSDPRPQCFFRRSGHTCS
jgi:hypothetical protein